MLHFFIAIPIPIISGRNLPGIAIIPPKDPSFITKAYNMQPRIRKEAVETRYKAILVFR